MQAYEVTVRIEDSRLRSLIDKLRPDLAAVVAIAAHNVEARAKEIIVEKKIIDTGATYNSVQPDFPPEGRGLVARIGPSTTYAPFLEFGTHKMRARPFMLPSLEQNRQPFIDAVQEVLRRG